MSLYKNKYRIESTRFKNWNYQNSGAYFITICTKNRESFFGTCKDGIMTTTKAGKTANTFWAEIPNHFPQVQLGSHIIMPNHIHGIFLLNNQGVETLPISPVETLQCNVSTNPTPPFNNIKNEFMSNISPKQGSISAIVRSYKSACTKSIRQETNISHFAWQERFHDHIIRNHDEYIRIENYINNNPGTWNDDRLHPKYPVETLQGPP